MPWSKIPAGPALIRWAIFALVTLAVILWLRFAPPTAPWSPQRILGMRMLEPEKVTLIEKVVIEGPERIRVIPKEKVRVIYRDLPTTPTMTDNGASVLSVADIPPSPEGGWAVSVLTTPSDNGAAVGSIEYKPKPVPFFAVKREMGIRGGYGTEGIMGELYARPLRIGPITLEGRVYGRSGNGDSEVGAAILLEMRF